MCVCVLVSRSQVGVVDIRVPGSVPAPKHAILIDGIGSVVHGLPPATPPISTLHRLAAGASEPWRFKTRLHPIHLAVYARSQPVVKRLLEAGAACDQVRLPQSQPLSGE